MTSTPKDWGLFQSTDYIRNVMFPSLINQINQVLINQHKSIAAHDMRIAEGSW